MKKYFFLGSILLASFAKAQLVNNGATIVIQPGGTIFCAGSFTNTSGTVTNDGRIEVQGNFANGGTYNSTTADDSLILSGSGNATLSGGGATFRYLTINKATNADLVTLASTVNIGNKLDFLMGGLSTNYLVNPSYSLTAPVSAVFNFAVGREIAGSVKRIGWTNGSMALFNGANMQVTTNGGTAPADLTTTMLPESFGGDPSQAEREVKRKFLFAATGGSGFTADIRFPYLGSELGLYNTEANLVPWSLVSSEWNARLTPVARDATLDWVSTTGIDAASLAQEWKLADPRYTFTIKAFIKGGWNNGTGLMRTNLNSGGLLPTSQPYTTAPWNYAGAETANPIPNPDIVDWVLLELRKPVSGLPADATTSTIIGRKAVFVLNNGTFVDLDGNAGTKPFFDIAKQGSGNYIVVRHRNHLAVMSKAQASNAEGTFANDFSDYANNYEKAGATSPAASMLATSGAGLNKYGLWPGDVNRNGSVTSSDVTPINVAIAGPASGNTNIYDLRDANLDRNVTPADASVANSSVAALAATSSSKQAAPKKESHVPGEVKN